MLSPAAKILHVHPDAARLREAVRARPGLRLEERRILWEELVRELAGARLSGRRACTPLEARTLLATEAGTLGATPYGEFVHAPAFAREALEALLALKAGGLSAAALQEAVEQLPPERRPRLRVLARLFDAYERRLVERGLVDREDLLRAAREALEAGAWPAAWCGVRRVHLHGLYDAPPCTVLLLLALAQACERTGARLEVELPVGGSAAADAALAPIFRAFERLGEASGHVELAKADVSFEGRPFSELSRAAFDPGVHAAAVPAGALRLWCAGSAVDEARLVARDVRRLVQAGAAPRDRDVPAWAPQAEPLATVGAVRFALELPLLVEDGFPVERVAALLDARYAAALSANAPAAPATLLAEAGVRDDRVGGQGRRGAYELSLIHI